MSKKKVDSHYEDPAGRYPKFSPQFIDDLGWWYKTDRNKVEKIFELATNTVMNPFEGLGKPEPLKHLTIERQLSSFFCFAIAEFLITNCPPPSVKTKKAVKKLRNGITY